MSGFVGVVNLDGAPVHRELLERLTETPTSRAPNGREILVHENIGFGQTLRCSRAPVPDRRPLSCAAHPWIIGDVRVDARSELIDKLNGALPDNRNVSVATPDEELVLAAYERWGVACPEYLLGDFSFAIWDWRARRLFCARDHFGVKPFYFARLASCLIFSNTLECVRMHPAVTNRLNDQAIADFLLFDGNQDYSSTSYSDVGRLPAAHTLLYEQGTRSVRRYWSLGVTTPVHFQRREEYVERFRELLDAAVADRLPTDSAGILMSGGLDSTIVAAAAHRHFVRGGNPSGLTAYSEFFDRLVPHQERHYAQLAADRLGIPVEFVSADARRLFEFADDPEYFWDEPFNTAWPDTTVVHLRRVAKRSRVALTGLGGDPLLSARLTVHFRNLIESNQLGQALGDAWRYLMTENRASRLYLRKRWRILFSARRYSPIYPPWINPELEKALCLRERWEAVNRSAIPEHVVRPEAHELTADPSWAAMFEFFDPGVSRAAVDVRHPFFDLRLVNFLLGLPRLPWCCDKEILREAGRGTLPEEVRLRPKSPMPAEPLTALLAEPDAAWIDRFEPAPELLRFVDRKRIPKISGMKQSWMARVHLRPLSLNFWFAHVPHFR